VDVVSLVIVVTIIGLLFQGVYRILFGGRRRTILPPTEINLPEFESESVQLRNRRRSGRRSDRSDISLPSEGLGEGGGILGEGIQEAVISEEGASAFSERLEREGAKRGSVQISLLWNNWNDLDLHVITPSGEHIFHDNRKSACGGELDLDMNFKPTSKTPVENVVWTKTPPSGTYRVGVRHYKIQHKNSVLSKIPLLKNLILKNETDFKVSVTIGTNQRVYEGKIRHNKINNELLFIAKFAIAEMEKGESKPKELVLEDENIQALEKETDSSSVMNSATVDMSLDSSNDLGLSLEQPDGQMISFLDVGKHKNILFDMDESANKQSIKLNNPVKGKYNIFIEEYETINGGESTKYDIAVNYKDGTKDNFEGVIDKGQEKIKVGEFEIQ
tara:strand:- start:62848 stop:64011 length:1164 start_codon:yes stop_codon:yes gene_type:complete